MIKFLLFFFSLQLMAESFPLDLEKQSLQQELRSIPVLQGGRIKPLIVLAHETMNFLSAEKKPLGLKPISAFYMMSLSSVPSLQTELPDFQKKFLIKIEHQKTKDLLGMPANESAMTAGQLAEMQMKIRMEYEKLKLNDAYKKDLNKTLLRLQRYQQLASGELWTVAYVEGENVSWPLLTEQIEAEQIHPAALNDYLVSAQEQFEKVQRATHRLETFYHLYNPFTFAIFMTLISLMVLFAAQKVGAKISLVLVTVILQIIGITMRVMISGRAPITNMYETVMFSGFGALIIGLIIFAFKREKMFLIAGLCYNLLCLLMMRFAPGMLDPSISPLVPVLRDNFWLSTHVTTVILSYAALALSWILANLVLIKNRFFELEKSSYQHLVKMIHLCVQIGVVTLATGIILGGVWADYSWGRFWGWDPKETWSLIVLLIYVAILHGKYTQWIPARRYVPLIAASFMSVMMAWFGVNYILAAGLHSYGFSEGGAAFLISVFAAQTLILLLTWKKG